MMIAEVFISTPFNSTVSCAIAIPAETQPISLGNMADAGVSYSYVGRILAGQLPLLCELGFAIAPDDRVAPNDGVAPDNCVAPDDCVPPHRALTCRITPNDRVGLRSNPRNG